MHGLQFSDKVKQLPRLTPIWAHGAVLAGVRLSESGNPTVLAPGGEMRRMFEMCRVQVEAVGKWCSRWWKREAGISRDPSDRRWSRD